MTATLDFVFPAAGLLRAWRRPPAAVSVQRPFGALPVQELARNAMVNLPAARGEVVECLEGCVWITFDHDARDVVVEAGERFIVDRDTTGWVQALEASRLRVVQPDRVAASCR